jgi:hypothetical protein
MTQPSFRTFRRFAAITSALFSIFVFGGAFADEPQSMSARTQAWTEEIERLAKKPYPDMVSDPLTSIYFLFPCKVQITYNPENHELLKFDFMKGDRTLVSYSGHYKSVFGVKNNVLYFVSYSKSDCGGRVTAFDLEKATQLWKIDLKAIGGHSHFGYSNEISMAITGMDEKKIGALIFEGHEEFGSYIEIRDQDTGELIAHKMFTNEEFKRRNDSVETKPPLSR